MWGELFCSEHGNAAPKSSLGAEWQQKFWLTSPLLRASATNANGCEIFSSRVMEERKELALSLRINIPINLFTHLSFGTSKGPKTCQAITQLHRSVHKILHIELAVICSRYAGSGSTCVRWQQRKQLFWETKSISTVAKLCLCFGKPGQEQKHLSIWGGGKKGLQNSDSFVTSFHLAPCSPKQHRGAQSLMLVTPMQLATASKFMR